MIITTPNNLKIEIGKVRKFYQSYTKIEGFGRIDQETGSRTATATATSSGSGDTIREAIEASQIAAIKTLNEKLNNSLFPKEELDETIKFLKNNIQPETGEQTVVASNDTSYNISTQTTTVQNPTVYSFADPAITIMIYYSSSEGNSFSFQTNYPPRGDIIVIGGGGCGFSSPSGGGGGGGSSIAYASFYNFVPFVTYNVNVGFGDTTEALIGQGDFSMVSYSPSSTETYLMTANGGFSSTSTQGGAQATSPTITFPKTGPNANAIYYNLIGGAGGNANENGFPTTQSPSDPNKYAYLNSNNFPCEYGYYNPISVYNPNTNSNEEIVYTPMNTGASGSNSSTFDGNASVGGYPGNLSQSPAAINGFNDLLNGFGGGGGGGYTMAGNGGNGVVVVQFAE